MNALIIANGTPPQRHVIRSLTDSSPMVVCADGGANYARKLHITPHVIIGDLDSITSSTKKYFSRIPLLHIDDQESTDLEKAITFCIHHKIASADIIGALGDRIDHTTGSLGCFRKFRKEIRLRFYDSYGVLSLIEKRAVVKTKKGCKLSLIPLEGCTGVTTQHLKYVLKNDILELGVREGISNEATSSTVTITVRKGTLLLYQFY